MLKIALFGKGGIGKSTLAANLAVVYARRGKRVLLVGCDPKHDTTVALTGGRPIPTVLDASAFMDSAGADLSRVLVRGRHGVDCVEAGGPEPGIGCAGRGISRTVALLEEAGVLAEGRYDIVLFDVLGDVVCGGFAVPLRKGLGDRIVIVTSEELMSLYAANNIARAIRNYSDNGAALCGVVANLRDPGADRAVVSRFAARLGTEVLSFLPREAAVREAEYRHVTVVEHAPRSRVARRITALADALLAFDPARARIPAPLSDEDFHALSPHAFAGDPPARAAAVPAPPAPQPQLPAPIPMRRGPDLEKAIARRTSLWDAEAGENSRAWGGEEQWRRFFCDLEARRNVRMSLESGTPMVNVWHQDLECTYSIPNHEDSSLPGFFRFPWPRMDDKGGEEPREGRRRDDEDGALRNLMTDLRDADVVHGGGRKLDAAIRQAVKNARGRAQAVVVHSTCIPTVIGDDTASIVERWRSKTKIPIVFINHTEDGRGDLEAGLILFRRLQKDPSFAKVARRRRTVDLVGFPPGEGLRELQGLLGECGIGVNACVMPSLDIAAARRYLAAELQVICPNAAYAAAYREFFDPLPLRSIRPAAPYGREGTRRWVESVAAEFGLERRARAVLARAWGAYAHDWRAATGESSRHGLAFVVDERSVGRLGDPAQTWAVPMLRVLREAGFGVEILCHGRSSRREEALSFFSTPQDLERLLAEGRFQAVYSEYTYDSRLSRAGKAQFSLDCFEPGFAGALRTLRRLNGICRWPFQRRYAAYMGGRRA